MIDVGRASGPCVRLPSKQIEIIRKCTVQSLGEHSRTGLTGSRMLD